MTHIDKFEMFVFKFFILEQLVPADLLYQVQIFNIAKPVFAIGFHCVLVTHSIEYVGTIY